MSGPDPLAMLVARLRNLERSMSFQSRDVAGARVCRLSAEAITELRGEIASLTAERDDAMALFHAAYKTLRQPITVQDAARVPEIAVLIKAAKKVHHSYWYSTDGIIQGMYDIGEALRAIGGDA